ncbi:MAG: hypothetical protein NWE86_01990 [Candidatus Bathyarchaeota archaeon]|nr:hypothetical protein [Candidatus Bathyarchaeota archaeon]
MVVACANEILGFEERARFGAPGGLLTKGIKTPIKNSEKKRVRMLDARAGIQI